MALTQQVYRIRTDATAAQGGTPVWAAVQNTNPVLSNSASFRIRFAISCITAAPASQIYNLFVSKNAGAYAQVPNVATSNPVYALDATSGASADNSALTTSLLTGATGTFSNVGEYDSDGSTAALAIPLSGYVELEFALKFNSAVIVQGDTYAFRVYQAGAVLTTYTVTPTLQVWVGEAVSKVNSYGVLTSQSLNVSKANAYAVLFSPVTTPAQDYLARTVGGNEGGNAANITTLINGLVSDGVWAKLDALYVLAQQNATDAKLNLIGTSYSLTPNGAFTTYKGYSGFTLPGMATGFNATLGGANFSQNSSSLGAWSYAVTADAAGVIATGDDLTGLYPGYSGTFYYRLNGSGSLSAGSSPVSGLVAADRSSSTAVSGFVNGVGKGATSASAVAVNNSPFYVGASASFGVTTQTLGVAFIGASLGATGQLALYNRLQTYMTAILTPPSANTNTAALMIGA